MGTGNIYADSNVILPVFSYTPTYNDLVSGGIYYKPSANSSNYVGSSAENTYAFYFYNTSISSHYAYCVCNTIPFYMYKNDGQSVFSSPYLNASSNGYYGSQIYVSNVLRDTTFPYLGEFDSDTAAISYFYSILTPIIKYPFTLQNGYLFVYDLGSSSASYSFDLTSKSEEYSNIGSNPFPDTNQTYWFSNTLPEIDETTIPASGATNITWSKGSKTNIFGQTQDMVSNISGTSTGRYLYIYNPPVHYKWSGQNNPTASEVINYPVTIDGISDNDTWYIYDSIARLADFNQGGKVTGTITGEQITGNVTSDGAISLNTSSGAVYTQNSGGSTDISGANGGSIAENINGLKQTLDNFVNQFIQLLSAPISHIQQLIQSSNSFFDVFGQLFDWLPSSVSSVMISGLVIMIVIGVLKMLL